MNSQPNMPTKHSPAAAVEFPSSNASGLNPRQLSIGDAAKYLGGTPWAVRRLIWQGQLSYVQVGKRFTISREELDAWIDRSRRREGVAVHRNVGANAGASGSIAHKRRGLNG